MELENDVLEAIKKNLPAQVSDVLRDYLAEAEINAKELAVAQKRRDDYLAISEEQADQLKELAARLEEHQAFDERQKALDQREYTLDLMHMTAAHTFQQQRAEELKEILLAVLRPSTVRSTIHKHLALEGGEYVAGSDSQGGTVLGKCSGSTTEVTDTAESTEE